VLEEDARRPVQLADDDPLGAVDDERGPLRHEGDLSEEDLLLLDVPDGPGPGLLVHVEDDQLDRHLMGAANVTPRSRHSSSDHFRSPIA